MSIEKLDFQKVTKENIPYSLISTKVIQNIKNKDALAVWVYLSSLPPDWCINKAHLKIHFKIGERNLQGILSYLNRANLLKYERERFADGTLGIVKICILCGDAFNENEPYILPTPQKTHVVDLTTPQKTTRVVSHPSGSSTLQKKQNTKEIKIQKKHKSFCKKENSKKHSWAEMKNESESIKKNQQFKKSQPSLEFKELVNNLKKGMKPK